MFILQMRSERELLKNGMEIRVWVVKKFLSEVDQIVVKPKHEFKWDMRKID